MQFAIPSKGRAGKVKSVSVLPSAVLYVPEIEAAYYMRAYPGKQVVGVPSEIKGITATRNFILDHADDLWVVMVDDDLKNQGWTKLYERSGKQKKLVESDWIKVCVDLFDLCQSLQWKIWGVKTEAALRSTYPYEPILSRSYITASFMGIVNDGSMRFDESFKVKEDYEIGLRHVKQFGGVVCARHVYWANSHWSDDGGCKDYRTGLVELDCINRLVEKYPGLIKQVNRGGSGYSIDLNF